MKITDYHTSRGKSPLSAALYKGVESMPFVEANMAKERRKLQELIDGSPEAKKAVEEFDKEYEFRRKLVLAREEAGLTQKQLQEISGLDQRAISQMEADEKISPRVRTLKKYLNAIGYALDIFLQ